MHLLKHFVSLERIVIRSLVRRYLSAKHQVYTEQSLSLSVAWCLHEMHLLHLLLVTDV